MIDPLQVTPPVDWDVRPEAGDAYQEEGSNNMELSHGPAKKQKWKNDNLNFDCEMDMPADPFNRPTAPSSPTEMPSPTSPSKIPAPGTVGRVDPGQSTEDGYTNMDSYSRYSQQPC